MPPFSAFLKSSRKEEITKIESDQNGNFNGLDNGSAEKAQRKQSKRDFFRSLLKRSSLNSTAKRRSGQFGVKNESQARISPDIPTSPMSDPNKPLPLPPAADVDVEAKTIPIRPVQNMQRIISPISAPELQKLFSGAPQFFVRSEGHHTGAPHPSVAFPWDIELEIRDLSDHIQIHDEAWSSVTAWPHITRELQKNDEAVKERCEKTRGHFLPRCRERPNMLSMQGIERGTVGYGAALEMGVADALREPQTIFPAKGPESLSERRKKFLNSKDGVRHLTDSTLLDCLDSASTTYHRDPLVDEPSTVQLYTELFTQILHPPSRVTDSDDPYSLQVQIEALINVLAADVWFDFSLVEWRIRLGQILWGPTMESDPEDDILVNNQIVNESGTQRYWLLLQILLSCELLLRLDAVSKNFDSGKEEPNVAEIKRFDNLATVPVRWSHILARIWLENVKIIRPSSLNNSDNMSSAPTTGWLATITGTAAAAIPGEPLTNDNILNVRFQGQHQTRQLSGLLHFARKLKWPNIDSLASKIASNGISIADSTSSTPAISTPLSHRSSSYFSTSRPLLRRGMSSRAQGISALINPAGWLSNSYISGLILPGEGLGHFLISTLLENDTAAVSKLGQEANLYGGFVYSNKSFWSNACIVGRVLAAGKAARECMGWISSDVTPRGTRDGWVDIEVDTTPETRSERDRKARIWHKTAIEHDGNVIGGADASSVLPGDFIIPSEASVQTQALDVRLESLDLFAAVDSHDTTPTTETLTPLTDVSDAPRIRSYSAMMRFLVNGDGEESKEVNLELRNDVQFVTAFPCVSSHHLEILRSPTSPSLHSRPHSPSDDPAEFIGHPLHKGFLFTKIALSALLFAPRGGSFESLLSPPQSPTSPHGPTHSSRHTTNSTIPRVLVVDCTDATTLAFPTRPSPNPHEGSRHKFGSDLEILARAICAERGWNALISRRGRGCLACSIREAGALGWRVILRIA